MTLLTKIQKRTATVGVIGLGYVGLPLAVEFAKAGFHTLGIDIDDSKVQVINAEKSYISDVSDADIAPVVKSGLLEATTDYTVLKSCDVVSICVPTPLSKTGDPNMTYVVSATDAVAQYVHTDMLVVLESTTYPGTTEEVIAPQLIKNGFEVGKDIFISYSPERIDPGRTDYILGNTPKVIGGMTPECLKLAVAFYQTIVNHVVPVSSPTAAEMTKLLENTFRSVNIALVNEMAIMCDKLGIDVWEVIEAAATKPYGFMKFVPGPGVGGHCIPVDPHYLSWKLKHLNYNARFIQLAGEVNTEMPLYAVGKIVDALNAESKSVNGSRILLLGVAYKPNVNDVRESPALDILRLLHVRGAELAYNDPYVACLDLDDIKLQSQPLTTDLLASMDCAVILTPHGDYDWEFITSASKVIIDTRNALPAELYGQTTVVRL